MQQAKSISIKTTDDLTELHECARRQQPVSLLKLNEFDIIKVVVSVHKSLNSCKGIVRDKTHCLSGMPEDDIAKELEQQSVTTVKRFTFKNDGVVEPINTYLFTLDMDRSPAMALLCVTAAMTSTRKLTAGRMFSVQTTVGTIWLFSKSCPVMKRESQIKRVKTEQNVSYHEAKKRVKGLTTSISTITYSAAVSRHPVTTASIDCQTDLIWVKSVQPLPAAAIKKTAVPPSSVTPLKPKIVKHVESQTLKLVTESEPEIVKLTIKERRLLKKKQQNEQLQTSKATSPLEVHNSFGPLEMEVTPSSHDNNRGTPKSRSRDISPVEAPP
ncbi:uncharacterized protein [Haliotis cracherodii]|uniref:uncharacterized protein n=1 Tax=Haliotis cracherodii TaxID=6455 RepID=UPI0039EAE0BB